VIPAAKRLARPWRGNSQSFVSIGSYQLTLANEGMERAPVKARESKQAEQRRRRAELLDRQKSRRAALTAQSRGLADGALTDAAASSSSFDGASVVGDVGMHSAPEVDGGEPMHTDGRGGRGRGGRRRAGRGAELTAAEWMVDIPSDLGRSWSVLARPSGVRCLVTSSGGETTRHNKSGGSRRFPSALPGGSRATRGAGRCEQGCGNRLD